jgi:hypothetical protein
MSWEVVCRYRRTQIGERDQQQLITEFSWRYFATSIILKAPAQQH